MADLNVGKLTFDLTVNDAPFNAGLKRSQMTAASTSAKTSASLKGVSRDADAAGKSFHGMAKGVNKAALSMAALAAGAVAFKFLKDSATAASDLNEAMNISTLVFKENAEAVQEWARGGAQAFGLSTTQAIESASGYANLFANVGVEIDEATAKSQRLVEISADMASAFNTTVPDAIQAISSGLRGEAEPLRRFGVMLDDVTLKAYAMEMGLYSGTGSLSQYAKAQAAYAIVLEKTATVQGDFANTAEEPANAARILQAEVDNLQASLGEDLLPIMKDVISAARDVVKWVGDNEDAVKRLAATAAIIGGIALAWKGVSKAAEVAASMQALAASGGMKGGLGKAGKVGAGLAAFAIVGQAASAMKGGDLVQLDQQLTSIEKTSDKVAFSLQGIIAPSVLDKTLNVGDAIVDTFIPVTRLLESEHATVEAFDEALVSLMSEGKAQEAKRAFDAQTAAAARYGATADDVLALLPGYSAAIDANTAALEDQAAAADKSSRSQNRLETAAFNAKNAITDARDATREWRRALRETTGEVLGGVDAFGGAPKTKDALGQDALLKKSAGSRDYMRQQAADMRALSKSGVTQATLDGLYEVEQSAPGTIRRIVSEGITKPFVKQLNADFAERARMSEIIAKSLLLDERDAKRTAVANARMFVQTQADAYAKVASEYQQQSAAGNVEFGSAEWLAGNRASTNAYYVSQSGGVDTSGMSIRNLTVVANSPQEWLSQSRRIKKNANSSGRRG